MSSNTLSVEQPSADSSMKRNRWARIAFILAGITLLSSALAKGYHLSNDPFTQSLILPTRNMSAVVVLAELGLGIWLLAGVLPALARLVAILCFGVFFAVSLDKAIAGEVSCGCFGSIRVTPWLTTAIDMLEVLLLFAAGVPLSQGNTRRRATVACIVFATVALPASWLMLSNRQSAHLTVVPAIVELGTLKQGEIGKGNIALSNSSGTDCTISLISSSCPCFSVHVPGNQVGAGQTVSGQVVLDLSHEPEFIGGLLIEVNGYTPDGHTAFRLSARVLVTK
jgi:hypothetical protein